MGSYVIVNLTISPFLVHLKLFKSNEVTNLLFSMLSWHIRLRPSKFVFSHNSVKTSLHFIHFEINDKH